MTSAISFPRLSDIPETMRIEPSRWSMRYLIGGEVCTWQGRGQDVLSPVCIDDGESPPARFVVGQTPMLDEAEAMRALSAAREAWDFGRGPWPTMRVARRIGCMEVFVAGMVSAREDVVRLLMWEIGKTRKDAETEFDRTVEYIRDTIEAYKELDRTSSRFVMEQGFIGQIRRSPMGVVLCMGPFNYPLNETYTTLIPALLMGNTIVSKLPKYGCLLHAPLLSAMCEAFPKGVVNVIQGDGPTVVGPMMQSGHVDVLAFIGTSRVANILQKQHPRPNRLRSILGLEAKNPAVVLPCADLDTAVAECVSGALSFNGQRCTALKLLLVHESIGRAFVDRFVAAVDAKKGGMPWESGVTLTPLPEDGKCERLEQLVADAVAHGAAVVNARTPSRATYFSPAVVYPVDPRARLYTEEQFGPIVPIALYREESEIAEFMEASPYGQQVSIFGTDPKRVSALLDALCNQVCRININAQCRRGPDTFPFTGRKDSAEGTLSVSDALRAFSIRNVVAISSNEQNKALLSDMVTGRLSSFLSTDFIL